MDFWTSNNINTLLKNSVMKTEKNYSKRCKINDNEIKVIRKESDESEYKDEFDMNFNGKSVFVNEFDDYNDKYKDYTFRCFDTCSVGNDCTDMDYLFNDAMILSHESDLGDLSGNQQYQNYLMYGRSEKTMLENDCGVENEFKCENSFYQTNNNVNKMNYDIMHNNIGGYDVNSLHNNSNFKENDMYYESIAKNNVYDSMYKNNFELPYEECITYNNKNNDLMLVDQIPFTVNDDFTTSDKNFIKNFELNNHNDDDCCRRMGYKQNNIGKSNELNTNKNKSDMHTNVDKNNTDSESADFLQKTNINHNKLINNDEKYISQLNFNSNNDFNKVTNDEQCENTCSGYRDEFKKYTYNGSINANNFSNHNVIHTNDTEISMLNAHAHDYMYKEKNTVSELDKLNQENRVFKREFYNKQKKLYDDNLKLPRENEKFYNSKPLNKKQVVLNKNPISNRIQPMQMKITPIQAFPEQSSHLNKNSINFNEISTKEMAYLTNKLGMDAKGTILPYDVQHYKELYKKERNRLAAKKSRDKKAEHLRTLEATVVNMEQQFYEFKEAILDYDRIVFEMIDFSKFLIQSIGMGITNDKNVINLFLGGFNECLCRMKRSGQNFYFINVQRLVGDVELSMTNEKLKELHKYVLHLLQNSKKDAQDVD